MNCRLCDRPLLTVPIYEGHGACQTCGLVQNAGLGGAFDGSLPDGWRARAAHLGPETCSAGADPAAWLDPVTELRRLLEAGPVYLETPDVSRPTDHSLEALFARGRPAYYEPSTVALLAARAGAADMAIDEVAGMVTCIVVPGEKPRTYAEALEATGLEELDAADVVHRLAHAWDPVPPETLGEPVSGACFLCGGVRRAWRSVSMCEGCSAVTPVDVLHTRTIDELHTEFLSTGADVPKAYTVPDMRTIGPDATEALTHTHGVVLDIATWPVALLMGGADHVTMDRTKDGVVFGGIPRGTPRRKTFAEAINLSRYPVRLARHTIASWGVSATKTTRFVRWLGGEECADTDYLRSEVKHAVEIASSGLDACKTIAMCCENEQADPDDWHADPYLRGFRAGRREGFARAQSMAVAAYDSLVMRTLGGK